MTSRTFLRVDGTSAPEPLNPSSSPPIPTMISSPDPVALTAASGLPATQVLLDLLPLQGCRHGRRLLMATRALRRLCRQRESRASWRQLTARASRVLPSPVEPRPRGMDGRKPSSYGTSGAAGTNGELGLRRRPSTPDVGASEAAPSRESSTKPIVRERPLPSTSAMFPRRTCEPRGPPPKERLQTPAALRPRR